MYPNNTTALWVLIAAGVIVVTARYIMGWS